MGWEIQVLEGVAGCAAQIEAGMAEAGYLITSSTPVDALLVDSTVLAKLTEMSGVEIAPLVNNLGETIGYTAKTVASSNGATGLSNAWVNVVKTSTTVTQEMIDAAVPMIEGGTTADLAVGDTITTLGLDAASGVGGTAGTGVGGTALATVAGPAIAVALGVASGVALYNIAPEFWTSVSQRLEAAGKMIGDKVISFFKTDGTEYYDAETIALIKQALIDAGYLSTCPIAERTCEELDVSPVVQPVSISDRYIYDGTWASYKYYRYITNATVAAFKCDNRVIGTDYGTPIGIIVTADAPNQTAHMVTGSGSSWQNPTISEVSLDSTYTYNGKTVYYARFIDNLQSKVDNFIAALNVPSPPAYVTNETEKAKKLAWIMEFGEGSNVTPSPNELPQEPNGDPGDDPNKRVTPVPTPVTDPLHDPTTDPNHDRRRHYDPTPTPTPGPEDDPEPHVDPNPQPEPDPNPDPNPTPDPDYPEDPTDPNPTSPDNEDEGHDPEPPPVIPMAANAISRVYNPTQSEVDALGNYLWNSVNIQDILGIFNSPIDGIIGFMKLYASPDTGDSREIKLGYLSTGVSAKVVTHQVVTVNCGVIKIPLSKKNATDYPPYTTVQIYLPFIGIEPLNGYDLVGSQLACIYRIDCYTGACIAQLKVTRDNMTAKLYEFSGNCAQHLPLTAGNFHQIAGNIISGAIGGALTGGIAGASIGAAQALAHSNIEVQRSGNLTANAGMLGTRTPYIIITRAVSADAANYSYFYGYPANKTVYLRNCRGYVRVKNIILHTSATEAEKAEIEELLKKGIYI